MYTHSVERRFIAIVCAALLILIAPLFALFFYLSSERALHEQMERINVAMTANAQALGKPLWDFDAESARKIAAAIISDHGVVAVHVRDNSGEIKINLPGKSKKQDIQTQTISKQVNYSSIDGEKNVGTLTLEIESGGPLSTIGLRDISFMGIFVFAILIVFASALFANRFTVIRPLLQLTEAVAATRNLGSRHKVDWRSKDEMGVLAKNFNEMQDELAREESELKAAHELVQSIYNQTPAMLYSLDEEGRIDAVSEYWLLATGYKRTDVIGQRFTDFLHADSRRAYISRTKPTLGGASTPGVTVKFTCADGHNVDVLIRETATETRGKQQVSLSVMTDVSELKEAETRNHIQAITDHLTGLLNRQGFEAALDEKITEANLKDQELACLFVDLDRFKWINDNLGHAAGDQVLQEVVARITSQLRPSDVVARLGGDEFAILVSSPDAEHVAREVADRVTRIFETPFKLGNTDASLSASVGIALYPQHAVSATELLQKSDMAMYARKRGGKNGLEVFNDNIASSTRIRADMERNIEKGLENDWFEAWLQPIHDLKSGKLTGFEALMRLNHPEKGILPPADIIAVAEETGTIKAIGNVIFEKAVSHLARLSRLPGLENSYVAINLSPLQLDVSLPARASEALMKAGISPSRVVLEITEAVLIQNNREIYAVLENLGQQGMRIALDDFGTGYSSLSYLHRFPVNIIKIDRSFVQNLEAVDGQERGKTYLLVEGINTIAHQIGCAVVAEGIEDTKQRNILAQMGVDYGQGYLFAKPMNIESAEATYTQQRQQMPHYAEN